MNEKHDFGMTVTVIPKLLSSINHTQEENLYGINAP